jgi:hypothetical protein
LVETGAMKKLRLKVWYRLYINTDLLLWATMSSMECRLSYGAGSVCCLTGYVFLSIEGLGNFSHLRVSYSRY